MSEPVITFTQDELLVLLIEECSEVIKAATKALRFGYDHVEPNYGKNSVQLMGEIGDVLGVVDALEIDLTWNAVALQRKTKMMRARIAKWERQK